MSMAKPIVKRLKTKYYYCSNLVYDNDNISAILFDGGYASVDDDNGIVMYFYVKDHLGSNRLVVDGNGNIEEGMVTDPLQEKYASFSTYYYANNNPLLFIDFNGKDGARIVDEDNKTLTIKADYFVITAAQQYRDKKIIST